jgi:hypothetical protein
MRKDEERYHSSVIGPHIVIHPDWKRPTALLLAQLVK